MVLVFLIAFVLGAILLYFELKQKKVNSKKMSDFISDIKDNDTLEREEKGEKLANLFAFNGYKVVKVTKEKVRAVKKDISFALVLLGFSMFGVGLFFYLGYYYFLQKERVTEIYL